MSKVNVIRNDAGVPLSCRFTCPGCGDEHAMRLQPVPGKPSWSFNGDENAPTLQPSILATSGHYTDHAKPDDCWCSFEEHFPGEGPAPFHCYRCHSFVTDGKIQFLSDCSHALAGQTVDLPDFDKGW
jgi:hypothetical protein